MPMLRPADLSRGLTPWTPRRRGEGNAGLVVGMVLIVVLCVVVIGGSAFFIITSWSGDEKERQWEGGAPSTAGPRPGDGPGAKPGGNAGATPNTPIGNGPQVGQVAPDITGEDIDGKPFKLSEYRGKVVMLDFWGHW